MDRLQVAYKGHGIVAAMLEDAAAAAVYRGPGLMLRRFDDEDIDAAVTAARRWIDARLDGFRAARRLIGGAAAPGAAEFRDALEILTLSRAEEAMLEAHASAEGMRVSMSDLAATLGQSDVAGVALRYAQLARRFVEILDISPLAARPDGSRIWLSAIAELTEGAPDDPDARWRLHMPMAEALAELGMI